MGIYKPFFVSVCLLFTGMLVSLSAQESAKQSSEELKLKSKVDSTQEKKEDKKVDNKIVVKKRTPSEKLLPANTRLWLSIPDPTQLVSDFNETQLGEITGDQALQPFVENVKKELKKVFDNNNIDLGIRPNDLFDVNSGEVCVAAVLSDTTDSDFGFVMLTDVKETEVEAENLLKRLGKQFKAQKGKSEVKKYDGVEVVKWTFERVGVAPKRFAFHAVYKGWLFVTDNEMIAQQMVKHISGKQKVTALADTMVFKTVREKSEFPNISKPAQVKWFVEPFGYFDIVQKIAKRHPKLNRPQGNDFAKIFRERGFDAIKGFGGNFMITDEKQFAMRSHIFAPPNGKEGRRFKGAAEILDFQNSKHDLTPEPFVSDSSSGYLTMSWNFQKAFQNIGPIMDAAMGENSFKNLIDSIKNDPDGPRVDLKVLIDKLDNRITFFTDNTNPINESSEKVVVGIKVKEDIDTVYKWVKQIINIPEDNIVKFEGINLYVDKNDDDTFEDEGFEDFSEEETGDEELPKPPKPIFDQRIYAATDGYILMSNDLEYMKKFIKNIKNKPGVKLKNAGDYKAVHTFLSKMSNEKRVSLRQFFRLDESVRVNYEMLRQGKMGSANTVLAKLLNQMLTPPNAEDETPRTQKIDGSSLPKDFNAKIAPYFGPGGIVLESVDQGWTISGVILQKKNRPKVASNKDGTEPRNQQ